MAVESTSDVHSTSIIKRRADLDFTLIYAMKRFPFPFYSFPLDRKCRVAKKVQSCERDLFGAFNVI